MKMQQPAYAIIQLVIQMNNKDNLLLMGQLFECASFLMLIGALLWLFLPEVEEALFSDKNYLDVKTIALMLIIIPAVVVSICGIYFLPELWWIVSFLQWGAFTIEAPDFAERCRKQRQLGINHD